MEIVTTNESKFCIYTLNGRFDAFGSTELEKEIQKNQNDELVCAVIDMTNVEYLSSAGLRVMLALHKKLLKVNGSLALVGVQPYCKEVLDVTGFSNEFMRFDSPMQAARFCKRLIREQEFTANWDNLETHEISCGNLRIMPVSAVKSSIRRIGDVRDILNSRITEADIHPKNFSETESSLGIGALGVSDKDSFSIMGDMMTAGGSIAWLPTDGHDTPDFLTPIAEPDRAIIKTCYWISLPEESNEFMLFKSNAARHTTLEELCREIFKLSIARKPEYKGILSWSMRAQLGDVYTSSLLKSPMKNNAPANGKTITFADNAPSWFKLDGSPKHQDVTALICGFGISLSHDTSDFMDSDLNSLFHLHPANIAGKEELLHNSAMIYEKNLMPEKPVDVDHEMREVAHKGTFIDMRRLLPNTQVKEAFIGVSYIGAIEEIFDGIDESKLVYPNPRPADHTASKRTLLDSYKKSSGFRR
jgi:anti-anti-sigma factor